MEFQYAAKARTGEKSRGIINADSSADARQRLREQGLFILSIGDASTPAAAPAQQGRRWGQKKVSKADVLMLTSQLKIMTQAGVDLAEALRHNANNCQHPTLKRALEEIHEDVSGGNTVSVALRQHSHIFGTTYVSAIAAAEASGTMVEVLGRMAELLRNEIRLRSTVTSVLAYPAVLSGVAGVVILALVFFVLPQFADVFENLETPTPATTQMLMDTASFLRAHILMELVVGVGSVVLVWQLILKKSARSLWDRWLLNGPVVRSAARPLLVGRSFRLLGTMLESNIPLLQAIHLCRNSIQNELYQELFDTLEAEVMEGNGISRTLASTSFIPASAAQMVQTAEETGNLASVMQSVGEYYEDDGEQQLKQLAKLLEPAILVVMGVVVSLVVSAVILPLLDVSSSASH